MNETTTHISQTLADFKQKLATKLDEARRILNIIHGLEEELGQTKTNVPELETNLQTEGTAEELPTSSIIAGRYAPEVRLDEFLGDPPLVAAKKYLKKVRRAVSFDEIANAVQRGGSAIKGPDWQEKLQTSLVRSTYDIVKVREGIFGLAELYTPEQLKGLRSTRRQPEPTKERRKPKRGRAQTKRRIARAQREAGSSREPPESKSIAPNGPKQAQAHKE